MNGYHAMIRYARPADASALVAAYDWLFAPPGVRPPDWSPAIAVDRLKATMADDRAAVLVADDNDTIVGFATVYLDIVSVRFGQRAWVEDLAVAPHRRSGGIGKALLDAAKPGLATMAPPGSSWSPDRPGSMPIASTNARIPTVGPDLLDGRCSGVDLDPSSLLQVCGQFRGRVPIHQPEGSLNPGDAAGRYLHRSSSE
jgi:GNAT superfamily N-acetyltransferase